MDSYLEILKEKAEKIDADISQCGYDKICITDVIIAKVISNLQSESFDELLVKAQALEVENLESFDTKEKLLDAIEEKLKDTFEKENELYTSIDLQKNFIAADFL